MKKILEIKRCFLVIFFFIFHLHSQSQITTSSFNFGFQTTDINFFDPNIGYVCGFGGSQGYISKTINGGTTWTPTFNILDPSDKDFYFVKSLTANNVIAIGEDVFFNGSIIYLSTDAGVTWTERSVIYYYGLRDAYFVNSLIGYAVGKQGTILKTTDGGLTWTDKSLLTSQNLTTSYFIDGNIGFAGSGNILNKTTDGGNSWLADTIPDATITDIVFFNSTDGYLLSNNGVIYYSFNGGDSWSIGTNNLYTAMYAMEKNSSGSVIASSNGNLCFKLSSSSFWEKFPDDLSVGPASFSFVNDTLCYSISDFSYFSKTVLKNNNLFVPVVRFHSSNNTICQNIPQQFLNDSKPGYNYKWYVGNVYQATTYNLNYTFTSNASYNVRLTAINPANSSVKDSTTITFSVPALPVIYPFSISASQNPVCEGTNPIIYINASQYPAWYYVIDSLGYVVSSVLTGTGNQLQITLPVISRTTSLNVVAKLATICDTVTTIKPITINVVPLADINTIITADRPFVCVEDSTYISIYNSQPGIMYRLMKNNLPTSDSLQGNGSTIKLPTHNLYYADAVFNVVARNSMNCLRQFTNIPVKVNVVSANYIPLNQNLYVGDFLQMDYRQIVGDSIKWLFYPDASSYNDSVLHPFVSFTATGIKTSLLTIKTIHGCIDSLRKNIYVYDHAPTGAPTICGATSLPIRSLESVSNAKNSHVIDMAVDQKKNIYLTGYTLKEFSNSFWDVPSAFILKCDSNMNIVWEKKLYDPSFSHCESIFTSSIITDKSGNIYIGGKYFCDWLVLDTLTINPHKDGEMFVAKFSPDGIIQWIIRGKENFTGRLTNGGPTSFAIDDAGFLYFSILHNGESMHFTFPDGDTLNLDYLNAVSILKVDPLSGRLLKNNSITMSSSNGYIPGEFFLLYSGAYYSTRSLPLGPKIKFAPNGLIYLVGMSNQKITVGNFSVDTLISHGYTGYTYFAAIADTSLNWQNAFPLAGSMISYNGNIEPDDLAPVFDVDEIGNIYFSFRVGKDVNQPLTIPVGKLNGNYIYNSGQFLTKFSNSGALQWSNLNEDFNITLRGLSYDSNSHLTLAGNFRVFFGYVSNSGWSIGQDSIGGQDLFFAQADASNGDLIWCRKYGSNVGWETINTFFRSKPSNDIYVSGGLDLGNNFLIDGFPIQNTMDNIILAKFNPDTMCTQIQIPNAVDWHKLDVLKNKLNLQVSYSNNQIGINFLLNESSPITLSIYDLLGKKVVTLINKLKCEKGEHKINFPSTLSSGIYFIQMEANNRQTVSQKIVVAY